MNRAQKVDLRKGMLNLNTMAKTLLVTTSEVYFNLRCHTPRYNGRAVYAKCLSEYEEAFVLLHAVCDKVKCIGKYCRACPEESNE